MTDDEVVATIGGELSVAAFDGAGSGFGLTSCQGCGRIIDRTCSVCPPLEAEHVTLEQALKRGDELRAQSRREHAWYDRGAR